MTLPSNDDRLVAFLRQHRPVPPPAPPDLENRVMAVIDGAEPGARPARQPLSRQRRWAVTAMAASVLLAVGSWGLWRTATQPTGEMAADDTFLMETWYGATYGDDTMRLAFDTTEPDWLFSVYATPY